MRSVVPVCAFSCIIIVRGCAIFILLCIILRLLFWNLVLDLRLMLRLEVVEDFNQQINVLEIINAQTFANWINFNLKLLLCVSSFASFKSLVIDKVVSLINEEFENILNFLVLMCNIVSITGSSWLIVYKLALALPLVLAVHDRSVLVHLWVALSCRITAFVAWVSATRVSCIRVIMNPVKILISRRFPRNW